MIGMMAVGRDALADDLNKFNRVMNLGHQLAKWFTGTFGSTQCRDITSCDFSTAVGVNQYIDTDGVGTMSGDRAAGRTQSREDDPLSGVRAVPGIVPASARKWAPTANSSQFGRSRKSLKREDLLGKTKIAEKLIGV